MSAGHFVLLTLFLAILITKFQFGATHQMDDEAGASFPGSEPGSVRPAEFEGWPYAGTGNVTMRGSIDLATSHSYTLAPTSSATGVPRKQAHKLSISSVGQGDEQAKPCRKSGAGLGGNAFSARVKQKLTQPAVSAQQSKVFVKPAAKWLVMVGMVYGVPNSEVSDTYLCCRDAIILGPAGSLRR